MIDRTRAMPVAMMVIVLAVVVNAQQSPQSGQQPAVPQPAAPPAATAKPLPGTVACPTPTPPATAPVRSFNAPVGMLLVPVLSTKVADFDMFLGYVRDALAKSTDATVRKQAPGWKFFKVSEPGPNSDVLYAFVLDPAVPCVDYALGPILAAAIADDAKVTEIMNLYKSSVRNGGTLLNLVPVTTPAPGAAPSTASPSTQKPGTQPPATPPLDANPIRPPN